MRLQVAIARWCAFDVILEIDVWYGEVWIAVDGG